MSVKKVDPLKLDLKKLVCTETFDTKQNSTGVFIEGFANKATVDRGDELIAPDAWELDNFKRNPVILFNHGMDTLGGTPVGRATEVTPTEQGLYLKVKLSNSQSPGIKMVRELVEERILKAFSVGFNPKQTDSVEIDGKAVRKISKAELFEVSIVGVPMNQDSLFDVSEKALSTKSFHQLKTEILTARKADAALRVEALLNASASRKDVIAQVATTLKMEVLDLLDMLSGEKALDQAVEAAFAAAIKAVDLKKTLEDALASLADGATDDAVREQLLAAMKPEKPDDEETYAATEEDKPEEGGQAEGEGAGDGEGAAGGEDEKPAETGDDEEARRKADFQDCVNGKIPKLLEEGMEQDQAVAAAIAQCQESGKCALTPESKAKVYAEVFAALDSGASGPVLGTLSIEFVPSEKAVTEEAQGDQAPTTPIKTEPAEDSFGSPYLEGQKQTNVLLGALINEVQKLTSTLSGLAQPKPAQSEDDQGKGQAETAAPDKAAIEAEAAKAIEALNLRLKNIGF